MHPVVERTFSSLRPEEIFFWGGGGRGVEKVRALEIRGYVCLYEIWCRCAYWWPCFLWFHVWIASVLGQICDTFRCKVLLIDECLCCEGVWVLLNDAKDGIRENGCFPPLASFRHLEVLRCEALHQCCRPQGIDCYASARDFLPKSQSQHRHPILADRVRHLRIHSIVPALQSVAIRFVYPMLLCNLIRAVHTFPLSRFRSIGGDIVMMCPKPCFSMCGRTVLVQLKDARELMALTRS